MDGPSICSEIPFIRRRISHKHLGCLFSQSWWSIKKIGYAVQLSRQESWAGDAEGNGIIQMQMHSIHSIQHHYCNMHKSHSTMIPVTLASHLAAWSLLCQWFMPLKSLMRSRNGAKHWQAFPMNAVLFIGDLQPSTRNEAARKELQSTMHYQHCSEANIIFHHTKSAGDIREQFDKTNLAPKRGVEDQHVRNDVTDGGTFHNLIIKEKWTWDLSRRARRHLYQVISHDCPFICLGETQRMHAHQAAKGGKTIQVRSLPAPPPSPPTSPVRESWPFSRDQRLFNLPCVVFNQHPQHRTTIKTHWFQESYKGIKTKMIETSLRSH